MNRSPSVLAVVFLLGATCGSSAFGQWNLFKRPASPPPAPAATEATPAAEPVPALALEGARANSRPLPSLTPLNSLRQPSSAGVGTPQFYTRMTQEPDSAQDENKDLPQDSGKPDAEGESSLPPDPGAANADQPATSQDRDQVRSASDITAPKPITAITFNFRNTADTLPEDRAVALQSLAIPPMDPSTRPVVAFNWEAPNICYRRLYFEDPVLERYGVASTRPQEVLRSAVHFSSSWILWPGRMLLDLPGACDTPLGYCRPGSPVADWRERLLTR